MEEVHEALCSMKNVYLFLLANEKGVSAVILKKEIPLQKTLT